MTKIPTAPPGPAQGGPGVPATADASPDKAPGVFRLDSMAPGVDNPEQALAGPRRARVSGQALVLGALLCVGGGLIYAMRLVGFGPLMSIAKTPVPEYDAAARVGPDDHKRIIADLSADHAKAQVPLDQVQKNPFRLSDVVAAPAPAGPNADDGRAGAERARQLADARRRKVEQALAGLQLNGVIGGARPVARISGEAVRVGDAVGEHFTVKAIHGRSVELAWEDQVFTLQMDDDAANSNKPRRK